MEPAFQPDRAEQIEETGNVLAVQSCFSNVNPDCFYDAFFFWSSSLSL